MEESTLVEGEIRRLKEKYRADAGRTATFMFLAVGVMLHLSERGFGSLFSVKAITFLFAGMFLAGIVLGVVFYAAHMTMAKVIHRSVGEANRGGVLVLMGVPFLVAQLVLAYVATRWAFQWWYS